MTDDTTFDLVHDVLDAQVLDRHGAKIGRVDGIVLAFDDAGPPMVVAIELGATPLAMRLHPRIGAWVARWLARRGRTGATRIAWPALARRGNDLVADVDADAIDGWALERWLRERVVGRIPGA